MPRMNILNTVERGEVLVLTGTGVINNSSNVSTLSTAAGGAEFQNTSTAGNAALVATGVGFLITSTAGNAVITNSNNETGSTGTLFGDTSTAANATITNNNGGFTGFHDASTAANAAILDNGGTTQFIGASTAGSQCTAADNIAIARAIEPTTSIAIIVPLPHQAVRIGSNAALWRGDKRFTSRTNVPVPMPASASPRRTCRLF